MSNNRFGESGYQRKLRDPRWQRRRLELLNKADWKCQEPGCRRWIWQAPREFVSPPSGDPPSLEIHHLYYEWGREPWDYPDSAFMVLCDECHEGRGKIERYLKRQVVKCFADVPASIIMDLFWETMAARIPDRVEALKKEEPLV